MYYESNFFYPVLKAMHIFLKSSVNSTERFLTVGSVLSAANPPHGPLQRHAQQRRVSSGAPHHAPAEPVLHAADVAAE